MEETTIAIKKNSLWKYGAFLLAVLVLGGAFMFVSGGEREKMTQTGEVVKETGNGDVQKVTLGTKNYNYYPETIKVRAGQPVSVTLDSSVSGCLRSLTIKGLGVSKYSKSPQDTIDFTPKQKGTFKFSCSMGMGYGTLIVE